MTTTPNHSNGQQIQTKSSQQEIVGSKRWNQSTRAVYPLKDWAETLYFWVPYLRQVKFSRTPPSYRVSILNFLGGAHAKKGNSELMKIQGNSQAPQPPTGFFVSFDVSLLGHWAHEFSVVV